MKFTGSASESDTYPNTPEMLALINENVSFTTNCGAWNRDLAKIGSLPHTIYVSDSDETRLLTTSIETSCNYAACSNWKAYELGDFDIDLFEPN